MLGKPARVALVLTLTGCCSNGRYPSDLKLGINVTRDEQVEAWKVNGEKVCPWVILATPGCYVLEVKYSASYTRLRGGKEGVALMVLNPVIGVAAAAGGVAANSTHHEYESSYVPFALRLRYGVTYYVTSTFTGDDFLPRIVESNAAGVRIGQLDPARSVQELEDCRTGKPPAAPQATPSASVAVPGSTSRISRAPRDAAADSCEPTSVRLR
jgi:hypothetical protein